MTTIRLNAAEEAFIEQQIKAGYYDKPMTSFRPVLSFCANARRRLRNSGRSSKRARTISIWGGSVSFDNAEELTALILKEAAESDN